MVGAYPKSLRRLWPVLATTVALPVAALGIGLSAAPAAGAGITPAAAALAPAPLAPSTVAPPPSTAPPTTPGTSPFPPSAPTNVRVTEIHTNSITVSWTAATPGCCAIVGYSIALFPTFGDVGYSTTVGGDVTTATITNGVQPGTQYRLAVSAKDSAGHYSTYTNITVVTPVTDTGPDTVPPSAPTNLTLTGDTLSWSPSTDNVGVTGYSVYRFDGWFASSFLATVTTTSFVLPPPPTAPVGLHNQVYVRARDAAGNLSIASNVLSLDQPTSPPPPPSPTCEVTYRTQSEWPGGFVAAITVRNTGTAAVNGWALTFIFPGDQRITNGWSSTYTQTGHSVTIQNADWNSAIAPNATATLGVQGTWTTSDAAPTSFALNGRSCAAG